MNKSPDKLDHTHSENQSSVIEQFTDDTIQLYV